MPYTFFMRPPSNNSFVRYLFDGRAAALVIGSAILAVAQSPASSRPALNTTNSQTLFGCHADHVFELQLAKDGEPASVPSTTGRHPIDTNIRLALNAKTGQVTLLLQPNGEPARSKPLRDIAQDSSPDSGTSGRADTTIRGVNGGDTFTLFAGYDTNGFDHSAALEIGGSNNTILVCDDRMYAAPLVRGIGRFGSTSIYTLSADGAASKLRDLPKEPDIDFRP